MLIIQTKLHPPYFRKTKIWKSSRCDVTIVTQMPTRPTENLFFLPSLPKELKHIHLVRLPLLLVGSHAAVAEKSRNTGPLAEQIDGASVSHQRVVKLEGADVIRRNVSCGQGFGYLSHDAALVCGDKSERCQTGVR